MKALAPLILIASLAACAQTGRGAPAEDGVGIDWRSAETYATAAATADPQSVIGLIDGADAESEAWACASCHGDNGEGTQDIPRLSGVSAGYLVKQMHDYRSGARQNDNMRYVVSTLTDDQLNALGKYYEALEIGPSSKPSFGGDLERGRALALAGDWTVDLPSCFSCHGPMGWGVEDAFPPISGQHPAYTHAQLVAWKEGRRANSPLGLMHSVAAALSDQDMRAVSDYLATLPPPQRLGPER